MKKRVPYKNVVIDNAYVIHPGGREVCLETAAGKREYAVRSLAMMTRQGCLCAMCGESVLSPQFDHEAGRGSGGSHRDDRIEVDGQWQNAALCGWCNSAKGSKRFSWNNGIYEETPCKN
jgi:hypothetical protein